MTDTMRRVYQVKRAARTRYIRRGTVRWMLYEDQGFQALLPWMMRHLRDARRG